MPDLRHDPINDLWISIAENRIGRPCEFEPSARPMPLQLCPFCLGNEEDTPQEIATYFADATFGLRHADSRAMQDSKSAARSSVAAEHYRQTTTKSLRSSSEVSALQTVSKLSKSLSYQVKDRSVSEARAVSHELNANHLHGSGQHGSGQHGHGQHGHGQHGHGRTFFGNGTNGLQHSEKAGVGSKGKPWVTRVIPNRFPAFGIDAPSMDSNLAKAVKSSPYLASSSNSSYQELILESCRHVEGFAELNKQELRFAFLVYRDRLNAMRRDRHLKHAMLFKNCRYEAGASLSHVHSQLVATDFLPSTIQAKAKRMGRQQQGQDALLQQVVEFERGAKQRIVLETENWVAFCPFASRFAFQTWIVSKTNPKPYWGQTDEALSELGSLVQRVIVALESAVEFPAYNVLFHNPPLDQTNSAWQSYVEVFARVSNPAGFEWGTDCWINPISPETAADRLRNGIHA